MIITKPQLTVLCLLVACVLGVRSDDDPQQMFDDHIPDNVYDKTAESSNSNQKSTLKFPELIHPFFKPEQARGESEVHTFQPDDYTPESHIPKDSVFESIITGSEFQSGVTESDLTGRSADNESENETDTSFEAGLGSPEIQTDQSDDFPESSDSPFDFPGSSDSPFDFPESWQSLFDLPSLFHPGDSGEDVLPGPGRFLEHPPEETLARILLALASSPGESEERDRDSIDTRKLVSKARLLLQLLHRTVMNVDLETFLGRVSEAIDARAAALDKLESADAVVSEVDNDVTEAEMFVMSLMEMLYKRFAGHEERLDNV